jgi:thioredoxin-like negative regulator of GroEL
MDDLAREYWGRIKVARFMVMTRFFDEPSPEIKERYDIVYIPTVILFDKGVEVDRWRLVVMEDVYRYNLNKFLKARAARAFARGAAVSPGNSVRGLQGE